jgi:hypothetical protein
MSLFEKGRAKTGGRRKGVKDRIGSDIDDLIAEIIRTSSWNPGAFVGTNPAALEAINYRNTHADFLTHGKIP